MKAMWLILVSVVLGALTGCGGKSTPTPTAVVPKDGPYSRDIGTGKIAGVVKFEGAVPERKAIEMGGDPGCAMYHQKPLLTEFLIVNDGRLQNAIVYIKKGAEKWSYPVPANSVVMNQVGCQYSPHVATVQTGQAVIFRNSDDTIHNTQGVPKINTGFNYGQQGGLENEHKFEKPELPVRVQCDVHKWMNAYFGVFDHPFHAVTNEKGEFTIEGVPPGDYELEAWHEQCAGEKLDGPHVLKVTVKDKETATVNFTFKSQ